MAFLLKHPNLASAQKAGAAVYYQMLRDKGKTAQMAKRALAYKWQQIIFRCWKDRVPYDEAKYIESLKKSNSPIYKLITE